MTKKTPNDRVVETGKKVISVRKAAVAGGNVVFIVAVVAGSYYVCPPDAFGLEQCVAVTKIGINSFISRAVAAGLISGVSNLAIFLALVRGRHKGKVVRAAQFEIDSD